MNKLSNFIIFIILISPNFLFSQDESLEGNHKGDWMLFMDIGFATIEAEDSFKANGNVGQFFFGKEFLVGDRSSLITGLEVTRMKTDFNNETGQQVFLSNNYLNLPISYRLTYDRQEKLSFYADLGISASYLFNSKVEIVSDDFDNSENGLGFNFGIQASLGAKFKFINDQSSISFGLKSKTDMVSSYKNSVQEFKMTDLYVFQLGLNFQL